MLGCCNVGARNNQSEDRKPQQKASGFVFYPSESSSDLAFSVNLRNIAKHYVHDEKTRNALTAKADEHVRKDKKKIKAKQQHNIEMAADNEVTEPKEIRNSNRSRLNEMFSRNRPSHDSRTAQSGKRSETFRKTVTIYIT